MASHSLALPRFGGSELERLKDLVEEQRQRLEALESDAAAFDAVKGMLQQQFREADERAAAAEARAAAAESGGTRRGDRQRHAAEVEALQAALAAAEAQLAGAGSAAELNARHTAELEAADGVAAAATARLAVAESQLAELRAAAEAGRREASAAAEREARRGQQLTFLSEQLAQRERQLAAKERQLAALRSERAAWRGGGGETRSPSPPPPPPPPPPAAPSAPAPTLADLASAGYTAAAARLVAGSAPSTPLSRPIQPGLHAAGALAEESVPPELDLAAVRAGLRAAADRGARVVAALRERERVAEEEAAALALSQGRVPSVA